MQKLRNIFSPWKIFKQKMREIENLLQIEMQLISVPQLNFFLSVKNKISMEILSHIIVAVYWILQIF